MNEPRCQVIILGNTECAVIDQFGNSHRNNVSWLIREGGLLIFLIDKVHDVFVNAHVVHSVWMLVDSIIVELF